jgi:Domain of unknown function (DUF3526)
MGRGEGCSSTSNGALRFLSPASLFEASLIDLSGTGRERYDSFLNQVERHRKVWMDWVLEKYARSELLDAPDYDRLPRFMYKDEQQSDVWTRVFRNIAVVGSLELLLVISAIFRYRPYPISHTGS